MPGEYISRISCNHLLFDSTAKRGSENSVDMATSLRLLTDNAEPCRQPFSHRHSIRIDMLAGIKRT
jgi:hypothetical protein